MLDQLTEIETVLTADAADYSQQETSEMIYDILKVTPEDVISRFDGIVKVTEMLQWEQGDLTNAIWESVQAAGLRYTFLDVCYFVSVRFLKRTRSHNTVKAWALTARKFPPHEREKRHFQDVPFAHFAYAGKNKFDGQEMADAAEILDWSYEQSQAQSYDVSVGQLREQFEGRPRRVLLEGVQIASEPEILGLLRSLIAAIEKMDTVSPLIRQGLELLRRALSQMTDEERKDG